MLQIKTGLAIHANYQFDVLDVNGNVTRGYTFLHTDLPDLGMDAFANAVVFKKAELGTSGAVYDDTQNGVLVPLFWTDMTASGYNVSYTDDRKLNHTTCSVNHTLWYTAFGLDVGGSLTLYEFGIRGLSRVRLIDDFQNLNGLLINYGDRLRVTVTFNYTYYANPNIQTLGNDTWGQEIDYTAETFVLPDAQNHIRQPFQGYGAAGVIRIYPITTDIRKTPTASVDIPLGDVDLPFQDYRKIVDGDEHRCDSTVTGFRETASTVWGFVFKDMIRQIGVLIRFTRSVHLDIEARYQVGGFIKWDVQINDADEGHVVQIPSDTSEQFPLNVPAPTVQITRPDYSGEVAPAISVLEGLTFTIGSQTITIPAGSSYGDAYALLKSFGLEPTLYSTRLPKQQPSTHTFELFNPNLYAVLNQMAQAQATTDQVSNYFLPLAINAANYQTQNTGNSWSWDMVYPYIGSQMAYYGYVYAGYSKAWVEISAMRQFNDPVLTVLSQTPLGGNSAQKTISYHASDYVNNTLKVGTDLVMPLVTSLNNVTDPTNTNAGYGLTYQTDFDTASYQDWVSAQTTINQHYRFCDLTTSALNDPAHNVIGFTYSFDSSIHQAADMNLWIGQTLIGPLSGLDLPTLNRQYHLYVTSSTVGTKTTYTFKKPFDLTQGASVDLYFIPTTNIAFSGRSVGNIAVTTGNQGYRVYGIDTSEQTTNVSASEVPFLMAGVRLYQPLPQNMFTSTILSAAQAATYYKDPTIKQALSNSLFTITQQNYSLSLSYTGSLDSLDPNLGGGYVYPAMGFDLSRIDDTVDANAVLFIDPTGTKWTKSNLLAMQTSAPERFIGSVLYFVFPTQLTTQAVANTYTLASAFYGESFSLSISIAVNVTYTLASAQINPSPVALVVGTNIPLTYTFSPPQATVSKSLWTVQDATIATVDQNGVVSGVGYGTTQVYLLLNGRVSTSVLVTVGDPDIRISCVGAQNITTPILPVGGSYDLRINDQTVLSSVKPADIRNYFATGANFRAITYIPLSNVSSSAVYETGFMNLSGTFAYVYIGNSLMGKNLTGEQVLALLQSDARLKVFN